MSVDELKKAVCEAVDGMSDTLLAVSREIHANPELAFEEVKAAALLTRTTEEAGLPVARGAYGLATAFESEFGKNDAPTVAILAEYDALPGIGHACGHNLIATTALGASLALSKLGSKLPGRVRFLGTPAEERGGGKELMAREGAFEDVDAAMMIHPSGVNLATMPCIAIAEVDVVYEGRSSHASAMPERGINALDALIQAYTAIAALRQHIRQTERIHGIIEEGGLAPNIVPERAKGRFFVRAKDEHHLAALKPRVQGCFEAGAKATGANLIAKWGGVDYLDLNTNWPLCETFQHNAEALGRDFFPFDKLPPSVSGSTDMGNVSHRVPSIHPMLACSPRHVVIHNPEFAKWAGSEEGDKVAIDGAKALAMTALDYFMDAGLRKSAAKAFELSRDVKAAEAADDSPWG